MRSTGIIASLFLLNHLSIAQIIYTRDFTEKLANANIHFIAPLDSWYKVTAPCQDQYNSYDLCLVSEKDSAELKYIILDEKDTRKIVYPQIHFMTKAHHLAINDEAYYLRVSPLPAQHILDEMKADWVGEVSFTPKKSISNKRYGKMYSIYKEDVGMAVVILFYNFEYSGFNRHLRSVSFNTSPTN